jgi:hypothetical protein
MPYWRCLESRKGDWMAAICVVPGIGSIHGKKRFTTILKKIENNTIHQACKTSYLVWIMKRTCFEKLKQAPFTYRFLDGITTSSMALGYLLSGGKWNSCLFLIYLIHAVASYCYHVYPSETTYFLDVKLINVMITERIYSVAANIRIYILCVCCVLLEPTRSHLFVMVYGGMSLSVYSFYTGNFMTFYHFYFFCAFVFFCLSFFFHSSGRQHTLSTLFTCLYHICLGGASFIEVNKYQNNPYYYHAGVHCLSFFLFTFLLTTTWIHGPKRTGSIFSAVTAKITKMSRRSY